MDKEQMHTPTPWSLGEVTEHLGYDCMTHGVRAGPTLLDASDYGQRACRPLADDVRDRMLADAALIVEAVNSHARLQAENKALREALTRLCTNFPSDGDMEAAGWDAYEVIAACDAYDAARATLQGSAA